MSGLRLKVLLAVLGIFCGSAHSAASKDSSVAAAPDSRVSVLAAEQVIEILDQTVDWYRTLGVQQQNATQPSDLLILFANRQTADQVVSLALEIARANAAPLSSEPSGGRNLSDASSSRSLNQQQSQLAAHRASVKGRM